MAPPVHEATTTPVVTQRERFSAPDLVARGGTIVSLGLLVAVFSYLRPKTFPTASNTQVILGQASVLAIVAGGLTIVLVLGEFDLSIASVVALSGVVTTHLLHDGSSVVVGIAVGIGAAILVGIVNGLIVAYLGINAFIATLGTGSIVGGVSLWVTHDGVAQLVPQELSQFLHLGQGKLLGIPFSAVIALVVLAVLWVFLNKTEFGRYVDATGGNREAARLSGINVKRYLLAGFVTSAACAGLGGVVLASSLGGGYVNAADSILLEAFTACFLGAVTLRQGEFHVVGTAVGVLVLAVTFSGLSQLNVDAFWQNIAQGAILIFAVTLTIGAERLRDWTSIRRRRKLLDSPP